MNTITATVSNPTYRTAVTLTKADVWGTCIPGEGRISMGMLIALPGQKCPYFNDDVPSKAVTVKVSKADFMNAERLMDVLYWLEFVQGAGTVERTDTDDDGNLIIRANYMCW